MTVKYKYMIALAQFRQHRGIILPRARLAVDEQQRLIAVFGAFCIVQERSIR